MTIETNAPDEVLYGSVGGNFVRFLADGNDVGSAPDQKTLNGFVDLTPKVKTVRWPGLTPPRLAVVETVTCPVIDGKLYPPDTLVGDEVEPDVVVAASRQPGGQPGYFPWTATFRLVGVSLQPKPVEFEVKAGERVDLTTVVPASPEPSTVVVVSHEDLVEVRQLKQDVVELKASTEDTVQTLISNSEIEVAETRDAAVSEINTTKTNAENAVTEIRDGAVSEINTTKTNAKNAINNTKTSAINSVEDTRVAAETFITETRDSATQQIDQARTITETSITNTRIAAETAIENARVSATAEMTSIKNQAQDLLDSAPKWWTGTQAQYDALPVKAADTLYLVV